MKKLTLLKPILVNNESVSEFTYDTNEITNDLYLEACYKSCKPGRDPNIATSMEVDKAFHLQVGKAAILAVNPKLDWSDLERISGLDLFEVAKIGRFFIFGKSGEPSEAKASEEESETSADDTTPLSQTSENGG